MNKNTKLATSQINSEEKEKRFNDMIIKELLEGKYIKFSGTSDTNSFSEDIIYIFANWEKAGKNFKELTEKLKINPQIDVNNLNVDYTNNTIYLRK